MIKLNSERKILPLIPIMLCTKSQSPVSSAGCKVVMEAVIECGIDKDGFKIVASLLGQQLAEIEFTYLYALKSQMGYSDDPEQIKKMILQWMLKVCRVGATECGKISRSQSAMFYTVAGILDIRDLKIRVNDFSSKHQLKFPKMKPAEIQHQIKKMTLNIEENIQLGKSIYPFGWFGDMAPIENIKIKTACNFDFNLFMRHLAGSVSLSSDEKKRIIAAIPQLTQEQIDDLIIIWEEERKKFNKIEPTHKAQLTEIEIQHSFDWNQLYRTF